MKAQYIGDLLFYHECVIVPGLGGFITSYVPARIDQATHRFSPPSCSVAFNAGLAGNDGILAHFIATRENVSYKQSLDQIKKWTEESLRKLRAGEHLHIENLGILSMQSEGNLVFEPDLRINFLGNSYGLPSFVAQKVHRDGEIPEMNTGRSTSQPSRFRQMLPETLKWAAVVTPFLAFALWGSLNGEKIDNYIQNYSGLNAWVQATPGKSATVKLINPPVTDPVEQEASLESTDPASFRAVNGAIPSVISYNALRKAQSPSIADADQTNDSQLSYFIIGGAFREKSNAEKLIRQLSLQGYPASIIDTTSSGMFIVGIAGFQNRADALKALPGIRNAGYSSAWIKHRG